METVALIKDFGFPIALLVAIGIGAWRATSWLGTAVILPIQERHMKFLDSIEKTLAQIAETQFRISMELDRISRHGCAQGPPLVSLDPKDSKK